MSESAAIQENIQFYRQTWDQILNRGNLDVIDTNFAPDYSFQVSGTSLSGPAEAKQYFGALVAAFSDIEFSVEEMIGQGEKVVKRWLFQGTHTGEFNGIPPTNRRVSLAGVTIARIVEGKIAEELDYYDNLGFLQQLGALPTSD